LCFAENRFKYKRDILAAVTRHPGNGMLLVLNLPLIGLWVKVLRVPHSLLYPLILLLPASQRIFVKEGSQRAMPGQTMIMAMISTSKNM
jgi:TctA family transporter